MQEEVVMTSRFMGRIERADAERKVALSVALHKFSLMKLIDFSKIPGQSDISISKYRHAILVDADFWREKSPKTMERDRRVNDSLLRNGWRGLRIWATPIPKIRNVPEDCIYRIFFNLQETNHSEYRYMRWSS